MKTPPSAAQRDVSLALRAWLRDDQAAVREIVRGCEDPQAALLRAMGLCMFFLRQRQDADALLDVLLEGDPLEVTRRDVSETARARLFLLKHLSDGEPKSMAALRALALTEGIRATAFGNAARQLNVRRGRKGAHDPVWSLPPSKPASKPRSR